MTQQEYSKLSNEEVIAILNDGGRFVIYTYAISILIMTFRRGSNVFLLKKGEWAIKHGYPYLLLSLLLGWWGIPWGPIYTIQSIYNSFVGKDITQEVLHS